MIFFKQIFTWWNRQTIGTYIYTLFFGKYVGKDFFGNKYYQNKNKRWVIYAKDVEATKITSEWYLWMHGTIEQPPTVEKKEKTFSWQKKHTQNLSGTDKAYKPNKIQKTDKFKKYETWKN
tara:strand:- start:587 stop:946 length:360 start_codon:yes stop_codon:yes gene_type:complete